MAVKVAVSCSDVKLEVSRSTDSGIGTAGEFHAKLCQAQHRHHPLALPNSIPIGMSKVSNVSITFV